LFREVVSFAPIEISLQSVTPPKTPVCFASLFTGAAPDQHGIRKYEKPVLKCDTLFDALIRAGKRGAIVAVRD
jgi:predicted AlkP superfamily phosphohydrolase/phosphomutase